MGIDELCVFFFKQKTAYEMRISDWSSDVCSSDLVQGFGGRLDNWHEVLEQARATPGVTSATPLIEQPLLGTSNGRVEGILVRGMLVSDIKRNEILNGKVLQGSLDTLTPGSGNVAIGSELARNLGAQVGSTITIINPAGRRSEEHTSELQSLMRISYAGF